MSITADPNLGLMEAHDMATRVHHDLLHAIAKLDGVTVHVGPTEVPGHDHHAALVDHR